MIGGQAKTSREGSLLWTLEEIGRLISQSGNASETLTNIVHLIQARFETDVCSVYLLEPDRANLVLAATIGLRPESVGRVRMRLSEGLAGLVAEQLRPQVFADATTHPRFKYFARPARTPTDRSSACRSSIAACCRASWWSRPSSRASSTTTPCGCWSWPACSSRRSSARRGRSGSSSRRRTSGCGALAQNLWWSWDADTTSLFRELDPVLWRELDNNPVALLQQIPVDKLEERASELALHSRINYAYRRMQEYLHSTQHLGRTPRRRAVGPARRLFLGGVRAARVAADLFRRPGHPGRRSPQERLGSRHSARRHRPVLRPGIFPSAAGSRRLAARGLHRRRHRQLPMQPAQQVAGRRAASTHRRIETRTGDDRRACLAAGGRPEHAPAARFERRGKPAGGPRADGAALRRRRARAHPAGAAARRRRRARAGRHGHRSGRPASERGAQRVCRARAGAAADGDRRRRRLGGDRAASSAQVVFTTHTPVPAGHDCFSADLIDEHLGPLRESLGLDPRRAHGAGPRRSRRRRRGLLHDGAGAQDVSPRQRRLLAPRRRSRAPCGGGCSPIAARIACRSATSPTASTSRAGSLRRCARSTTAISARTGPSTPANRASGSAWTSIDDGELWETHQTLKMQLIEVARRRAAQQAGRRGEPPEFVDADAPGAEPRRADDRLRAALRHLQARRT